MQFHTFLQCKYTYLCISHIKYPSDPVYGPSLSLSPSYQSNYHPEYYTALSVPFAPLPVFSVDLTKVGYVYPICSLLTESKTIL